MSSLDMQTLKCTVFHFFLVLTLVQVNTFDPLSVAIGIGSYVYKKSVCSFKECCTKEYILADFDKLEQLLKERVYGQHIAVDIVLNALRGHWNDHNSKPEKALTMSFHGFRGGGKNYIVNFVKESLFSEKGNSRFVHHFMGRLHFKEAAKTREYQDDLYQWIKGNVTNCPRQLFVFDEVDKMPPKVLDVIKPLIDYNRNVEGVDYSETIFIFLSNTGENAIINQYLDYWQKGVKRETLELHHFENLITKGAFNEEGGFYMSDTIKDNLIDHYIPFLPLEKSHVNLCIYDQFKLKNIPNPDEKYIEEIMKDIEFAPEKTKLFSKTGCKRVSQKVSMITTKYFKNRKVK